MPDEDSEKTGKEETAAESTEGHDSSEETGEGQGEVEDLERLVEELEDALEHRKERIEELESKLRRSRADFQNYKKRAKERMEKTERRTREEVIESFLKVRDDVERALESDGDVESIKEGLEMTLDRFDSLMEREGVQKTDHSEFDPERHEAIASIEAPDLEGGEIVEVHRPGFESDERVIRPARVTVAEDEEEN